MSEGFHNPYTFIPLLDRSRLDKSPLGDRGPLGHDRDVPSAWNAHLRVVLTVHTPLLLLDPARATRDRSGHQTYPVRLDAAGRPYLAPTAVKGMLRSAYEVVTNSRLGVFWGRETLKVCRRPTESSAGWPSPGPGAKSGRPIAVSSAWGRCAGWRGRR